MQLFDISFIAEVIAFICSLTVWYNKGYPFGLKILIPYLLLTLAVEFLGYFITEKLHFKSNHPLYNAYMLLSILFYLRLLGIVINDGKVGKIVLFTMVGFAIFALLNICFMQGLQEYNTYTFIIGGFLISGFCLVFFVGLLNKEGQVFLLGSPAFWLSTGLLLYYLPKIIFYTSLAYLSHTKQNTNGLGHEFHSVNNILICILYASISINFLCKLRRAK